MTRTKNYKEHLLERLQTPEDIAGYVNAAIEVASAQKPVCGSVCLRSEHTSRTNGRQSFPMYPSESRSGVRYYLYVVRRE